MRIPNPARGSVAAEIAAPARGRGEAGAGAGVFGTKAFPAGPADAGGGVALFSHFIPSTIVVTTVPSPIEPVSLKTK